MRFHSVVLASLVVFGVFVFYFIFSSFSSAVVEEFVCTAKPSMVEKMKCQSELSKDDLAVVLPVQCMQLSGTKRTACRDDFKRYLKCSELNGFDERDSCFQMDLEIPLDLSAAISDCKSLFYARRGTCISFLKQKYSLLAVRRMSEVQNNALQLFKNGKLSESEAFAFIANVEEKKQVFLFEDDLANAIAALKAVQGYWLEFKSKV